MPSPLLHGAAGAALAPAGASGHHRGLLVVLLIAAANAPDLDLVPGLLTGDAARYHHGFTHSLGAAAMAGAIAAGAAALLRVPAAGRLGLLIAVAFASHLPLDMLSVGKGVHNAIPLFWPASHELFTLPPALFPDIEYDPRAAHFFDSLLSRPNFSALLVEVGVIAAGTIVAAAVRTRRPKRDRERGRAELVRPEID